ncbi:DsbA family protein [Bifidobacterium cuniculi]|uniref:DSBA oxidoreductase n=1 Tax=Bifidobacterium cuniculi TaxID=1688 RepID=A0A087ANA5_9BIFI|nr:thioredoxin domain-containing protein [Bifidobacterium cuniculi]KFI60255.1 DSBA oxidoreductase [Bifidobacterium cuniculi]
MADNGNRERRAKRLAERAEAERRAAEQRARDRRQQTIIGVVVAVVAVVLVAVGGFAIWRSTHQQQAGDTTVSKTSSQSAYAELQAVKTKPGKADDQGGISVSKNGYDDPVEGVPTVAIYMDFMCPGCGELNRSLDQDLVTMMDAGQINLDLHFMTFMDRLTQGDEYSIRAANVALAITEEDPDPSHLFAYMENLYAKDFQPDELDYQPVSDEQIREQARDAGVTEDVIDSGLERNYDDWLLAVNTYTPTRTELIAPGQSGMSTPTMTINGYYWNFHEAQSEIQEKEGADKATLINALLDSIGLPRDDMGKAGMLPSIGADGKPLLGYSE